LIDGAKVQLFFDICKFWAAKNEEKWKKIQVKAGYNPAGMDGEQDGMRFRANKRKVAELYSSEYEERKENGRKNAPEMQNTELAAVTARSRQRLFYLLALEGIGLISAEDEDLGVLSNFLDTGCLTIGDLVNAGGGFLRTDTIEEIHQITIVVILATVRYHVVTYAVHQIVFAIST
jgi:hypothetical protein